MINRAKMPRQLRNKGGIMTIGGGDYTGIPMGTRTGFGLISKVKDRVRKLIPNELANVAVKAAPFVAPFNPGIAGLMRGIGRFDQRGSISDALKQGIATTAFGAGSRFLGGAENIMGGGLRGGFTSPLNVDRTKAVKSLFKGKEFDDADKLKRAKSIENTPEFMKTATEATIGKVPLLDQLPPMVQQKLLVGGVTAGASALYSYFTGEFEPQQPGETMGEYMARRNKRVKEQMRGYMDSYYTPLRNPQYAAMSDEEKNNFIDNIVGEQNDAMMATGGRVGYQTGGISSANTLAENIARNRAAQSAFQQSIAPAQQRVRQKISRSDGLGDYVGSADLSGGTENINSNLNAIKAAATVPFNFVKGVIGNPLNPEALTQVSLTQAQKQRLNEIAKAKGTATGNIDYSDYGSPTPTFSGIYPKTMSPLDASLATTMGGTDFRTNPDGTIELLGGKYDFQKGSNPIYNFIDRGGIAGAVAKGVEGIGNLLTPSTAMAAETTPTPDAEIPGAINSLVNVNRPTMADVAGPSTMLSATGSPDSEFEDVMRKITGDSEGYAAYAGIIPGFKARKRSDGRFEYKALDGQIYGPDTYEDIAAGKYPNIYDPRANVAGGGMPMGIMRSNKAGVMERDYRDKGGFVPVGIKEKADDVPAMLSKNEFVMTANAVRGAGNGSIEKGAQRMYDTMKRLEKRVR